MLSRFLSALFQICLVGATLALFVVALFRPDLIEQFIEWIGTVVVSLGAWNYLIAFTTAALESFPVLGTFLPGQQVMLVIGGFYGNIDLPGIIAVSIAGACIGNWLGYIAGVYYGEAFLEKYGDMVGLGRTETRRLRVQIQKNGAWFIILGKFHNFARAFIPFIAGSMGMRARTFWIYNIAGSILWATVIISLGVFFIEHYEIILDWLQYIILGLLVAFGLYIWFFRREAFMDYLREKQQEIEEKSHNHRP